MNFFALPLITKILLASSVLIVGISLLWMIVLGFQRKLLWGVALLVGAVASSFFDFQPQYRERLGPVAIGIEIAVYLLFLVFLIMAWHEARRPFFWSLAGVILLVMAVFSFPGTRIPLGDLQTESPIERLRDLFSSALPPRNDPARSEPRSTPEPVFRSLLPAPTVALGEKEPPRPGIYYLTQRVSVSTPSGVKAANPGEKAILLRRLPEERLRVQVGLTEFEVESSQVTDDLSLARELEKREFQSRGGRL